MVSSPRFCEKIKEIRLDAGLTIVEAAETLGIPKRTYENWEGKIAEPPSYVKEWVISKFHSLSHLARVVQSDYSIKIFLLEGKNYKFYKKYEIEKGMVSIEFFECLKELEEKEFKVSFVGKLL